MPDPIKAPAVNDDWQLVADDKNPENIQRTYFEGPSQTVKPTTTLPTAVKEHPEAAYRHYCMERGFK